MFDFFEEDQSYDQNMPADQAAKLVKEARSQVARIEGRKGRKELRRLAAWTDKAESLKFGGDPRDLNLLILLLREEYHLGVTDGIKWFHRKKAKDREQKLVDKQNAEMMRIVEGMGNLTSGMNIDGN